MGTESIVVGGGCFWCTEAVFQRLKGVIAVEPGYAGGITPNPTYEQVNSGTTGHAETVKITYNPIVITIELLLLAFFSTHDPTTPNRQGNDVGSQYRSIILTTNQTQLEEVHTFVSRLISDRIFDQPIITEVRSLTAFYPAEDYHKDYYNQHQNQPYCQIVINPKLDKLRKTFTTEFLL